jgi:hypothetical protein
VFYVTLWAVFGGVRWVARDGCEINAVSKDAVITFRKVA